MDSFEWVDRDEDRGRVSGYEATRDEQGDVPAGTAGLLEVGARMAGGHIEYHPVFLSPDQAVSVARVLVEGALAAWAEADPDGPPPDLPMEARLAFMRAAASHRDMLYFVREEDERFVCTEIETGATSYGSSAIRAIRTMILGPA